TRVWLSFAEAKDDHSMLDRTGLKSFPGNEKRIFGRDLLSVFCRPVLQFHRLGQNENGFRRQVIQQCSKHRLIRWSSLIGNLRLTGQAAKLFQYTQLTGRRDRE